MPPINAIRSTDIAAAATSQCSRTRSRSDWAFGTGDFTAECWAHSTGWPTGAWYCPLGNSGVSSDGWEFQLATDGTLPVQTLQKMTAPLRKVDGARGQGLRMERKSQNVHGVA